MEVLIAQPRPAKKSRGVTLLFANSTLFVTFLLSVALHIAMLYGVPSIVIFSEGGRVEENTEPIEVALLSSQESADLPDATAAESNQFATDVPSALLERELALDEELVSPDALSEDEDAVTLLSRLETHAPEMVQPEMPLPQRAPPSLDLTEPERLPRLLEKSLPDERDLPKPHIAAPEKFMPAAERKLLPSSRIEDTHTSIPSDRPATFGMPGENGEEQRAGFGIYAGPRFDKPQPEEDAQLIPPKTPEQREDEVNAAPAFSPEQQIEGPIKGRAVAYRPAPPQANITINIELRFRFWVLPDGSVGEIIPVKRGNAELEQIAISYLKQWRFEPLPSNVPQQQVWGTIPIKFIAQ